MKTRDLNQIIQRISELNGIDWTSQEAKDMYEMSVQGNYFLIDRLNPNICYQFSTLEELESENNPEKYGRDFNLNNSYFDGEKVILETSY